ncbi:hypothetical protein BH10ACI4_BH10ACI4_07250 [soil metagenome]
MRPHTSHSGPNVSVANYGGGIPIQCERCPGQAFRRSSLRTDDLKHLLLMRYPVRCLRCGQRQAVSFTVAGISVPSHIKQRRVRHTLEVDTPWTGAVKESLRPKARNSADADSLGTDTDSEDSPQH